MSGFDMAGLLPVYLDEADEQIAALNETLLRLEQSPDDEDALRLAFRMIHTLKGSATMLGFDGVKGLTHHLETIFDQLRGRKRALDRPFLDLCFRCLDALRDYHRDLRSQGRSDADLTGLAGLVLDHVGGTRPAEPVAPKGPESEPAAPPDAPGLGVVRLTIAFEPGLPWPDMKAKLILNRLAAKASVLATEPPVEQLEDVKALAEFRVDLRSDSDIVELLTLADVDGVAQVSFDSGPAPTAPASPAIDAGVADHPGESPPVGPPAAPGEAMPVDTRPPVAAAVDGGEPSARRGKVAETVRVDVDRLDSLMNLAGELVINKSRFHEIARGLEELFRSSNARLLAVDTLDRLDSIADGLDGLDDVAIRRWSPQLRRLRENFRAIREELDLIHQGRERLGAMADAIHHLTRVTDGIQRGVLETRMVPIGPLFDRFRRVVRDLRLASNKEVDLKIGGEKTELDKRMIDELGDPLIHLVRNAVDHGLESPEQREAAGKPRSGTVSLSASHRGNSVVIAVADDGRGIDRERVRRKAVARGLIGDDESRRLNDRQLVQFIWHPGFSTAEHVTDISGRGVGMDIVKSRIDGLNGNVDVRTEPGLGTTFVIRLPLTLAIMPVLLARVGGETYAIPLDHLDEIVDIGPGQIRVVQGRRSIEIRGRIISVATLTETLLAPAREAGRAADAAVGAARATVVVVSNGEQTMGLIVDELIGMQEAVLKSLERNFRPVLGLSGATILGDGRVSLILDIDALIAMVARGNGRLAG